MLKAIQQSQLTDNHLYVDEIKFDEIRDLYDEIKLHIPEILLIYVMAENANNMVKLYVYHYDLKLRYHQCGFIQGFIK